MLPIALRLQLGQRSHCILSQVGFAIRSLHKSLPVLLTSFDNDNGGDREKVRITSFSQKTSSSSSSFLENVLSKARQKSQHTQEQKQQHHKFQNNQSHSGKINPHTKNRYEYQGNKSNAKNSKRVHVTEGDNLSSLGKNSKSQSSFQAHKDTSSVRMRPKRRRMTAAERDKLIPSLEFISDPETRQLVRNAYKYGKPGIERLQRSLNPEKRKALLEDIRPEENFKDDILEFPEFTELFESNNEQNALKNENLSDIPSNLSHRAILTSFRIQPIHDEAENELLANEQTPQAVVDMLRLRISTNHTLNQCEITSKNQPTKQTNTF